MSSNSFFQILTLYFIRIRLTAFSLTQIRARLSRWLIKIESLTPLESNCVHALFRFCPQTSPSNIRASVKLWRRRFRKHFLMVFLFSSLRKLINQTPLSLLLFGLLPSKLVFLASQLVPVLFLSGFAVDPLIVCRVHHFVLGVVCVRDHLLIKVSK
jgi:hypothetical protein